MDDFRNSGEFRYPRRRPWILLLLAAVIAAVVWIRVHRPAGTPETDSAVSAPVSETTAVARVESPGRVVPSRPAEGGTAVRQSSRATPAATNAAVASVYPTGGKDALAMERAERLVALKKTPEGTARREIEDRLGRINIELAMTPRAMPEKVDYVVQRGDSVERIARRFGTTADLLQKTNTIRNPHLIKAGDRMRILKGKFRIAISKSRNELVLHLNGEFFKRYAVGTGKFGGTPEGLFAITERIKDPVWWRPDGKEVPFGNPENILGTRWMTLRARGKTPAILGYGIHGTWDDSTIGKALSAGCIRMRNADVEELFLLTPVGTEVEIGP